jgi:hypothetical protein
MLKILRWLKWLFRRNEPKMMFIAETKMGFLPAGRNQIIPILYRRVKVASDSERCK